jgi:hypothetical protein
MVSVLIRQCLSGRRKALAIGFDILVLYGNRSFGTSGAEPALLYGGTPTYLNLNDWLPKSVGALRTYSRLTFLHDVVAGVTVGLVLLAMAFAIAF